MNIIEAAKTGLRMRPVGSNMWLRPDESEGPDKTWSVSRHEILSDWEVDEPKVTITRGDLEKAVNAMPSHAAAWCNAVSYIAKELGL